MTQGNAEFFDARSLADGWRSGIHRVIAEQDHLNRINVFPVADSDTGTNLSLSLATALPVLDSVGERPIGELLAATADALLDGSRGNSGAIIAQFFQGLSDSAGDTVHFTLEAFVDAAAKGADYARDALSRPREGTVLTAITAFANALRQKLDRGAGVTISELLLHAAAAVDDAVENTPTQLDVLKKAGVVDAGAQGFAYLVRGFQEYFASGIVAPKPDNAILEEISPAVEFSSDDNASQFRFCTECIVTGESIDRRKLREALGRLGDSLVLAGTKRKAKIHIHSDDPDEIFATAKQFGSVSREKADDMQLQQSAAHDQSSAFAVITDSGADISDEDLERLDIHMVPCRIQFGDRGYLDKVSISTDEFYAELKNNPNHPTTSQPAPGDFRRQFQFLASHYSNVISINLTSAASGTYEAARSAAARSDAPGRIHVIDSLNASTGQGQLAVLAAEYAKLGHSVEDTLRELQKCVAETNTFAVIKDLKYAVRGGRLSKWVKIVADSLRMVPVICVTPQGKLGIAGAWFGRRNPADRLANFVAKRFAKYSAVQVTVGHAACLAEAEVLATAIKEQLPGSSQIPICDLGTAIGVHGGPGTLIVSIRSLDVADGDD